MGEQTNIQWEVCKFYYTLKEMGLSPPLLKCGLHTVTSSKKYSKERGKKRATV
jgi:hypothetical protein